MTIGKISSITGISESTLRYYEAKGLIHVMRDSNNRRVYAESDISWIQFIQKLKETGMLLRDIQKYSELRYKGDSTMSERLIMMQKHKEYVKQQCDKWELYSQNLDNKITYYKTEIANSDNSNPHDGLLH